MDGAADDKVFLEGGLEMLRALAGSDRGCVLVLVGNWKGSLGTAVEIVEAKKLGVQIFENYRDCHSWIEEKEKNADN